MKKKQDPLDGIRGRTGAALDAAAAEAELRKRLGDDAELVDVLIISERMEHWINADPVGKFIYKHAQDEVAKATETIFSHSDLTAKVVTEAHFRGRVAIAMLKLIDDTLQAGKNAAQIISDE